MLLKTFYKQAQQEQKILPSDFQLSVIPKIDEYRKQQSLVIAPEKKTIINRRIKIQGIAAQNARMRILKQNLYLNFNVNPFSEQSLVIKPPLDKYDKDKKDKNQCQDINIIDKLYEQVKENQKSKTFLKQTHQKLQNIKVDYDKLSRKIHKSMTKQKQQQKDDQFSLYQKKKKLTLVQQLALSEIQRLVQYKQQNFYVWSKRKINIFKIIRDDNGYLSPLQQLQKQNFSFTGLCQKPRSMKIPIFRDLSNMGRRLLSGGYRGKQKVFDHILSHQLILHMSDLNLQNILSVASNRFTPIFIQKQIYGGTDENKMRNPNDSQSQQSNQQQDYDWRQQLQICKMTNYGAIDLQNKQIQDFKKYPFDQGQRALADTCETEIQKIIKQLKTQNQITENTIRDKKLHLSKTQNIQKSIRLFNKIENPKNPMDIGTKVRLNKWNKDRKQLLKVKKFGELLKQKNQFNRTQKILMRQNLIKNKQIIHIQTQ